MQGRTVQARDETGRMRERGAKKFAADRRIGGSADRRIGGSADRRIGGSAGFDPAAIAAIGTGPSSGSPRRLKSRL
jgi:hypothetical protein